MCDDNLQHYHLDVPHQNSLRPASYFPEGFEVEEFHLRSALASTTFAVASDNV